MDDCIFQFLLWQVNACVYAQAEIVFFCLSISQPAYFEYTLPKKCFRIA